MTPLFYDVVFDSPVEGLIIAIGMFSLEAYPACGVTSSCFAGVFTKEIYIEYFEIRDSGMTAGTGRWNEGAYIGWLT